MSEYTVLSVGEPKPWSNDFGAFLCYPVDLEDETGKKLAGIDWNRKEDSKPPEVGDRVAGHLEPGRFSDRLKVDFEATKELKGGGRSGSSGGGNFKSNGKSPDQQASIVRQHSQQVALEFLALNESRVAYEEKDLDNPQFLERVVKPVIDWFEADANKAASGAGAATSREPTPRPPQASDTQGVHELLYELFEKAGEAGPIATLLTDWVISTQEVGKQDDALAALRDDKRKAKCVAWARAGYEKAHGPLPVVSDDGDPVSF